MGNQTYARWNCKLGPGLLVEASDVSWRCTSIALRAVWSAGLFLEARADKLKIERCPSGLVLELDRSRVDGGGGGGKASADPGLGEPWATPAPDTARLCPYALGGALDMEANELAFIVWLGGKVVGDVCCEAENALLVIWGDA